MTEPCLVCPSGVVRCGHLGEKALRQHLVVQDGWLRGYAISGPYRESITVTFTGPRAEADAEFDRREEALLA